VNEKRTRQQPIQLIADRRSPGSWITTCWPGFVRSRRNRCDYTPAAFFTPADNAFQVTEKQEVPPLIRLRLTVRTRARCRKGLISCLLTWLKGSLDFQGPPRQPFRDPDLENPTCHATRMRRLHIDNKE
jgi:hypothetical protein